MISDIEKNIAGVTSAKIELHSVLPSMFDRTAIIVFILKFQKGKPQDIIILL